MHFNGGTGLQSASDEQHMKIELLSPLVCSYEREEQSGGGGGGEGGTQEQAELQVDPEPVMGIQSE